MIIPSKHCGYGEGGHLTSERRVYDSGPTSPTNQTVTQTTIPEYARPYVEATLGRAYPMIEQPMQQYQGERFAQFTPLQQQVFEYADILNPAPQMQTASDIAAQAAKTGLGYGEYKPMSYRPESFTGVTGEADVFGNPITTASRYMNPYMEQVLQPQLQAMQRQADIQRQQIGAQAAQAGAFGGARSGLMNQQLNAELMRQKQQAVGQAYGQAYGQGMQQFNAEQAARAQAAQLGEQSRQYGAGLGLQGLGTALQGAGQLGNLGQGQFGQTLQALGLQSQLGAQQQQQMQNILSSQYQDWLNYQNYPYKQLGFMSDILRGMPLTQTSQTMYQAPPTMGQTLASVGLGAAGLSNLMRKEGGTVSSYADGGTILESGATPSYQRTSMSPGMLDFAQRSEPVVRMAAGGPYPQSVTSSQNVESILDKLSDTQLKQARQIAVAERDAERVQMIDRELAQRASERQGLGAAFNMSPMAQEPAQMALGGIVAFAGGGAGSSDGLRAAIEDAEDDANDLDYGDEQIEGEGVPDLQRRALMQTLRYGRRIGQFQPTRMTPEEETAYIQRQYEQEQRLAGPNEAAAMLRNYLQESEAGRGESLRQAKGLALLEAADRAVQPGGTIRGLAGAGAAFGKSYNKALEADRAEKRALKMAQFQLLDAERKEKLGFTKSAMASLAARQRSLREADKNELLKLNYQAQAAGKAAQAARPLRAAGAGSTSPKEFQVGPDTYLAAIKEEFPTLSPAKQRAMAFQQYQERKSAGLPGVTTRTESAAATAAAERARKTKFLDPKWQEALKKRDPDAMATREKELVDFEMSKGAQSGNKNVIKLD